ncbi:MAG: hypothetical protein BGN88_14430 [Clostridiales bacterium 43-6]|nr:MAG: hypothetical protein BGN88_14430 [Clostridiales bacterium 43-6]
MAKSGEKDNLKLSDEQLAERARCGDNDAFSALVARYVFTVKSRANHYNGSGIDPEDLAQEGTIGLMAAVRSYDKELGTSFRTFAWLCIDRSILSVVKASLRKKQIPKASLVSIDDNDLDNCFFDGKDNPETLLIENEDIALFELKINELLSPFERKVLRYYLSGKNYSEIADSLNTLPKSVDNALQRVRHKLR